jgi:hypothetical protein
VVGDIGGLTSAELPIADVVLTWLEGKLVATCNIPFTFITLLVMGRKDNT